jgi:hypothetical protein
VAHQRVRRRRMMTLQSMISLTVLVLLAARRVNIL